MDLASSGRYCRDGPSLALFNALSSFILHRILVSHHTVLSYSVYSETSQNHRGLAAYRGAFREAEAGFTGIEWRRGVTTRTDSATKPTLHFTAGAPARVVRATACGMETQGGDAARPRPLGPHAPDPGSALTSTPPVQGIKTWPRRSAPRGAAGRGRLHGGGAPGPAAAAGRRPGQGARASALCRARRQSAGEGRADSCTGNHTCSRFGLQRRGPGMRVNCWEPEASLPKTTRWRRKARRAA